MVDTVKLILDKGMFAIMDKGRFEKDTMISGRGVFKVVQNPSKTDLEKGIYYPRLTFTHRFNSLGRPEETLAIEFSVPKLLYGNNFDEVTEADFQQAIDVLKIRLKTMSVLVFEKVLAQAPVSSIHYSKNFVLIDGSIPYTYMKEIEKVNMTKRYDLEHTSFRNEGHGIKYHTNSFEVAFYDKLKDLEKAKVSEKRAFEKDSALQLNLFEELKIRSPFEVIRMEVRLNRRQKIRAVLKDLSFEGDPTFHTLYNQDLSQKVLLSYMSAIENGYPSLLHYQRKSSQRFLSDFLMSNPETKMDKAIKALGMKTVIDDVGLRGLRELLKKYSNRSWYRLYKEARGIKMPQSFNCFSILKNQLEKFQPFRVASLQVQG